MTYIAIYIYTYTYVSINHKPARHTRLLPSRPGHRHRPQELRPIPRAQARHSLGVDLATPPGSSMRNPKKHMTQNTYMYMCTYIVYIYMYMCICLFVYLFVHVCLFIHAKRYLQICTVCIFTYHIPIRIHIHLHMYYHALSA